MTDSQRNETFTRAKGRKNSVVNGSADFGPNFVDGILVGEDTPLATSETKMSARFKNKMVFFKYILTFKSLKKILKLYLLINIKATGSYFDNQVIKVEN